MKAPYQRVYESPMPKMVDLGGGLLHSGLKSSFVTFIPTNMVPILAIEQVNVTLSRRSIIQKKIR